MKLTQMQKYMIVAALFFVAVVIIAVNADYSHRVMYAPWTLSKPPFDWPNGYNPNSNGL